jgi:hypothetical protein
MDAFASPGPVSPTGDFAYGKRFDIIRELPNERYVVADEADRPVAFLPWGVGGEVRARAASWTIAVERRKLSWAIVAYSVHGAEVGGAAQKLVPNAYKLWLRPDELLTLTKNPIRRRWKLSTGHRAPLARFDIKRGYGQSPNISRNRPRMNVGSVETADYKLETTNLVLPIVLALEMIKAEMSIGSFGGPDPAIGY